MAHTVDNSDIGPEERHYLDYMQKGDDFMKISIYRSAKEWYTKALEFNFNRSLVQSKLDECNSLIQDEKKKIFVIVAVIAIAVTLLIIF
jgi:hypothetical protein